MEAVFFLLGMVVGGSIMYMLINRKPSDEFNEILSEPQVESKVVMSVPKVKKNHVPPQYYGYGGGFATITKCTNCGRTALYEDAHTVNPCHSCGARVKQDGSAKWDTKDGQKQWVKPEFQLG